MNPIKFRCYRCNQLLGVSRQKAGQVVGCPRCLAELVVPDPDETDSPPDPSGSSTLDEPTPFFAKLPTDLASPPTSPDFDPHRTVDEQDIRPEDIRVEAGVGPAPPPTAPQPPPAATAVFPLAAPVAAADVADPALSVPPIKLDGPPRKTQPNSPVTVRSRDLILPRSVVASWSLFVLLALASAFFAGLFAGHYVWRVH